MTGEHKELGKRLHKLAVGTEFVKEIKLLVEDLRMWTARNEKMDEDHRKDAEKQATQQERLGKLTQDGAQYRSEQTKLKSAIDKIASPKSVKLPPIRNSAPVDQMKDSIKDEYFSKKQELKAIEKKIIISERQKEDLATKLKESDRLGKIARSKVKKIKGMIKAEKWKDDDDDLEKEKDDGKEKLEKLNKEGRGWKREDMYAWK